MSINIKIAKAYFIISSVTLLGNILSLLKELLVANYFGITKVMDAFSIASIVPWLVSNTILSCFSVIFLPIFIKHKIKNKGEADLIASIIINYLFISIFIISIFIFIFSPLIIKYGFSKLDFETMLLSIKILKIITISIVFLSLSGILSSLLNAYEDFLHPGISNTFITISTILFIVFFTKQLGIFAVIWGFLIGSFFQFIFLIPFIKNKYNHSFNFKLNHPVIKETFKLSLIFILLSFIWSLNQIINRIMASWLPQGSIAALGYAERLFQVPIGIFMSSIATAIYPFFSMQVAEEKIEEMKSTLATTIKTMGFIFIPLTIIMIILAKPTIKLLFERGAFDIKATNLTSCVFICYSLQLFSWYAGVIMVRLLFIFQQMADLFKLSIVNVILQGLLNYLFIKIINPPVAGIGLSSSVVCFVSSILCFFFLKRKISNLHGLSIISSLSKTFILAIISGIIVFIAFQKFDNLFSYSIVNQIIKISVSAGIGICVFILMAYLLKMEELGKIYFLVKSKMMFKNV